MTLPPDCRAEMYRSEERLEKKIDDHTHESSRDRANLHNRITALEIRVAYYAGGAAAIGGLFGTLAGVAIRAIMGG